MESTKYWLVSSRPCREVELINCLQKVTDKQAFKLCFSYSIESYNVGRLIQNVDYSCNR